MPIVEDKQLYNKVKREADRVYGKPSAYKSGWIVKTYKQRGGTYLDDNKSKDLKRWFKEEWGDIGGQEYPVYRPFKRVSKDTPLTASEIDPTQAKKQIALKQKIKGEANLPKFKAKGEGLSQRIKAEEIKKYSNPDEVVRKAKEYFKDDIPVYLSTKKDKKYMVQDPNGKWVHFGAFGMEDYTKHKDEKRRTSYLKRSTNIKGKWKDNPYSPNNLSIHILW